MSNGVTKTTIAIDSPGTNPPGLKALPGPELVFGLIGAVGTDLAEVSRMLSEHLKRVNYTSREIHVSRLLHTLDRYADLGRASSASEYCRIKAHMQAGSRLRTESGSGEILALMAVAEIRALRMQYGRSEQGKEERQHTPLERTAYIIRSLKHPSEINTLRDVYGRAFFVISAYTREENASHHSPRR